MRNAPIDHLPIFVYGTLLPDQPNAHLWQGEVMTILPARLPAATLYNMGYYPMLIETGTVPVYGCCLVVQPASYEMVLARLDHLEGVDMDRPEKAGYRRVRREVELENGRFCSAWLYLGHPRFVVGRPVIATGRWAEYIAGQDKSGQKWWSDVDSVGGHFDKK